MRRRPPTHADDGDAYVGLVPLRFTRFDPFEWPVPEDCPFEVVTRSDRYMACRLTYFAERERWFEEHGYDGTWATQKLLMAGIDPGGGHGPMTVPARGAGRPITPDRTGSLPKTTMDLDPVAYWPLAETQGTFADDVAGVYDELHAAGHDRGRLMPESRR